MQLGMGLQVCLLVIKAEKKDKHDSPFFKALAAPRFYFVFLLTSVICLFSDLPSSFVGWNVPIPYMYSFLAY